MNKPELTVIWATRDDDYANGVNDRMVRSIRRIQWQARRFEVETECLVVDFNTKPPKDLIQLLTSRHVFGIRVISVPDNEVRHFTRMANRPFVEYIAKNIGVRRAMGKQVMILNPDILMSDELFTSATSRPHLSESFLRADREDFSFNSRKNHRGPDLWFRKKLALHIRHGISPADAIELNEIRKFFRRSGSIQLANETYDGKLIVGLPGGVLGHHLLGMHTNAAGDLLVASLNAWITSGGFFEDKWLTNMGDSMLVAKFTGMGLRQIILPGSGHLMHEHHPSDLTRGGTWHESMWPPLEKQIKEIARGNFKFSADGFGLPYSDFQEFQI